MRPFTTAGILIAFGIAVIAGIVIGVLDLSFTGTLAAGLTAATGVIAVVAGAELSRQLYRRRVARVREDTHGQLHIPGVAGHRRV